MRAIAIDAFGGRDRLRVTDLPPPRPSRGEVLLHVVAAGVNPVDWKIREGWLQTFLPHAFPLVPGWEAAGVVEELGEGTERLRKGDRVWTYARKALVQGGTYAEYVVVPEASCGPMPANLLFEEAAGVPLAALTAWQELDRAGVGAGTTVLVHAAAGGVGHFAVQLAKHRGARVLGTAGTTNQEFVLAQGAEGAIDYTREDFVEATRRRFPEGAEVVLDHVGGDTLERSFAVVRPGGVVVSIVSTPDPASAARVNARGEHVFVEPNAEELRRLALLSERKVLRPHVQKIYPLADAPAAHEASEGGHVRGKLVLAL